MFDTHLGRLARDIHEAKVVGDFKHAATLSAEFVDHNDTVSRHEKRTRAEHFRRRTHVVVGDHQPEPRMPHE